METELFGHAAGGPAGLPAGPGVGSLPKPLPNVSGKGKRLAGCVREAGRRRCHPDLRPGSRGFLLVPTSFQAACEEKIQPSRIISKSQGSWVVCGRWAIYGCPSPPAPVRP